MTIGIHFSACSPMKDYPSLRDFFQKMNTQYQAQVVLKLTPSAVSDGAATAPG